MSRNGLSCQKRESVGNDFHCICPHFQMPECLIKTHYLLMHHAVVLNLSFIKYVFADRCHVSPLAL